MYRYLSLSGIILALVLVGCRKHVEAIAVFSDGSAMFVTHASDIVNTEPGDTESAETVTSTGKRVEIDGAKENQPGRSRDSGPKPLTRKSVREK